MASHHLTLSPFEFF